MSDAMVAGMRVLKPAVCKPQQPSRARSYMKRRQQDRKQRPHQQFLVAAGTAGGDAPLAPTNATTAQGNALELQQPSDPSMTPEVQEALAKVQAALADAEENVQTLHTLPSAQLPTTTHKLLAVLRPLAQFAALTAFCAATHSLGLAVRVLGSLAVGAAAALYGWRRSSLSASGAVAAAVVGWATLGPSFRGGMLLLTFFLASSKITQLGEEVKDVEEGHKKGGQRDWRQVACNAAVPAALALAAAFYSRGADVAIGQLAPSGGAAATRLLAALNAAFLGYYACCCGDTWSSELGQLSPEEPRLITTLRPVRKGTNGGVTLAGLAASLAGGLAMGVTFLLATIASPTRVAGAVALPWWRPVALGLGAGCVGSLIDSLLGATIQFTGYNRVSGKITGRPGPDVTAISGSPLLDNNAVNGVSASLTAALSAAVAVYLF